MGTWQPPPSVARTARSAVTQILVDGHRALADIKRVAAVIARLNGQSALANRRAHHIRVEHSAIRSSQPRRRSPAEARRIASYCPSSSLRRRVSTLPRIFSILRSDRKARSCAARRSELVPIRAPDGKSASCRPPRHREDLRAPAWPRESGRSGTSVGISFRLCTARSMRCSTALPRSLS